ncbi:bifunctional 3-oxoadipate enol-lactonase/4-carboxymuconolactone decarboxylase PcaDC [Actinocorallia populi]|uniref:bifunctional 3-oxoadipate enol-lactonase/4-carboxymuconolactone decarboxylase PcaDC n=1 Tax=Actinocorallia populi TaxID=2079200 RepID=UPI000D092A88|nr:4-carboxymuconolactone decarboxylase [Actinocorallia populi]
MSLHHRLDGPEHGAPLILGPSLGTSLEVWKHQVDALARRHRVLRFDLPGHGGSATDPAADTVERLARLVLELADAQGWETFHYAGISLGGAIGAALAASRPERVSSLAMICSSARFGTAESWLERAALVREKGMAPMVAGSPGRWFAGPHDEALVAGISSVDPEGYAACCSALAGYDLRERLGRITCPTLVLAGRDDVATPPAHARELADGIADAALTEVPRAGHLAPVDQPEAVTTALLNHLGMAHSSGMRVRRAVLGDAHVDRAIARTTPFTADFQDFITRYAWGEIWTRPGLDRRTRSCITLTALVAGGHHDELAMHVRAGLNNGLTPDEIKEVLLQTAVYCGVPAANSAFAVAQRVLNDQP